MTLYANGSFVTVLGFICHRSMPQMRSACRTPINAFYARFAQFCTGIGGQFLPDYANHTRHYH